MTPILLFLCALIGYVFGLSTETPTCPGDRATLRVAGLVALLGAAIVTAVAP